MIDARRISAQGVKTQALPPRTNDASAPIWPSTAVLGRHLDLAPLRGRGAGLVRCPFHSDRRPSLSVDLRQGLFHCFGCGVGGGVRAFARLVGETLQRLPPPAIPQGYVSAPRRQAFRQALDDRRRAAEWARYFFLSEFIRACATVCARERTLATRLGADDPRTWPLLERAAQVERDGLAVEAELEAILESGRIA